MCPDRETPAVPEVVFEQSPRTYQGCLTTLSATRRTLGSAADAHHRRITPQFFMSAKHPIRRILLISHSNGISLPFAPYRFRRAPRYLLRHL